MERNLVTIQKLNVDTFTFSEAINYATKGQVVTINPEMIDYASKNKDFANIINEAELVIPDGIGVQLGLKILGHNVRRIAGIEFARKMIEKYSNENKSIALVGAKPHVIENAVANLKKEIPNINIVYYHDGYFKDNNEILSELQKLQPALVLSALGSPKQEEFNYIGKKLLPESLFIGVGGSFDVWSGEVERAPQIYQKLCIEWLYRTIKEPKRFKRIFPTLPLFVLKVLKEKITGV